MRSHLKQEINRLIALEALLEGGGSGPIENINVTAPITTTGGNNPNIGISPATDLAAGSLSAADKTKLDGLSPTPINSITGTLPITVTAGQTPVVAINAATESAAGSLSAADKIKLDNLPGAGTVVRINNSNSPYQALHATFNVICDVSTGNGTNANTIIRPPATPSDNDPFSVKVNLGDASAAPILIEPSAGQPAIEDPSQPGTFRTNVTPFAAIKSGPGAYATWRYNAALNQWLLYGVI